MPTIAYDPSPAALFDPGARPTVFAPGQVLDPTALAVESARLAYVQAERSASEARRLAEAMATVGFESVETLTDERTDSQAFAAYRARDGMAVVAFRGTEPKALKDILGDVDIKLVPWPSSGKVHAGFAERTLALLPAIRLWLETAVPARRSLLLTGHSLGGALATLAATLLQPSRLITIGSPQVGNASFAAAMERDRCLRIANCIDAVTRLPSPFDTELYTHVGSLAYVSSEGAVNPAADPAFMVRDQLWATIKYRFTYPLARLPRSLADHAPVNYVRAFF